MRLVAVLAPLAVIVALLGSCSIGPITALSAPAKTVPVAVPALPCPNQVISSAQQTPAFEWLRTVLATTLASGSSVKLDWYMHQLDLAQARGTAEVELLACLRSVANRALDAHDGWRYLDEESTPAWSLVDAQGNSPVNPVEFVVADEDFYIIDGGTLYRGALPSEVDDAPVIALTELLTEAAVVEGFAIQEPIALGVIADTHDLIVLDRANDLYRFDAHAHEWRREADKPEAEGGFTPQYVDLTVDADGAQFLDVAGNRVAQRTWTGAEWNIMNSGLTWAAGSLGHGVAIASTATASYVLLQNGEVLASSGLVRNFTLPAGATNTHLKELANAPSVPVALGVDEAGGALYIAEEGARRVVALATSDGSLIVQIAAPSIPDFSHVQGVQASHGALWVLAGGRLFRTDLAGSASVAQESTQAFREMPAWTAEDAAPAALNHGMPQALGSLAALAQMHFTMPIAGARLPERMSLYPGARRSYRYGVHHGIDFFAEDSHVPIDIGTPVRAVMDGTITRADANYVEMSISAADALLDIATQQHGLSDANLDRLGGRQVRISHGQGVWSIYSHLNSVADGLAVGTKVKAGNVIGTVGVSGTSDGVRGAREGVHLHFELWLGNWPRNYLGQWLTLEATQRIYKQLFTNHDIGSDLENLDLEVGGPGRLLPAGRAGAGARPADHYWLGSPFAPGYNHTPSTYYSYGDTAGGALRPHRGVDTSNPIGAPLLAAADGTVVFAGPDNPELLAPFNDYYGNAVVIQLDRQVIASTGPKTVYVLYGHMDRVDVVRGQRVARGQQVGTVGETGIALGPHLHMEVRVGENVYEDSVNPLLWMQPAPGSGNLALRIVTPDGRAWDAATVRVQPVTLGATSPASSFKSYRTADGIGSDPVWGENLVIPALGAGTYSLSIDAGDAALERRVAIQDGRTTFLEVTVGE